MKYKLIRKKFIINRSYKDQVLSIKISRIKIEYLEQRKIKIHRISKKKLT